MAAMWQLSPSFVNLAVVNPVSKSCSLEKSSKKSCKLLNHSLQNIGMLNFFLLKTSSVIRWRFSSLSSIRVQLCWLLNEALETH